MTAAVPEATADAAGPPCQDWWQGDDALPRFLADLINAEARRLRPAWKPPEPRWSPDMRLDEAGLGFDSLERLQLAAALSESLHLHESGIEDYLLARSGFGEWCEVAEEALGRFSATLTVRTSGSTGMPKPCPHPLAKLEREVDALAALLPDAARVLAAVPCHHIYGFLFTILLPRRLGVPVLDIRGHSPSALPAMARRGDLVIGHPAFWAAVARAAPSGWPAGVTGVTSTAPCPAEVAVALAAAGLSRLLQVHGSSETAGLGWRDDPYGPYTLLPHWQRAPGDRLLQAPLPGVATAAEIMAPDRLEWLDQRRYRVGSRLDGAVQVGGFNVFPARVGDVLREHPDVAAAVVRLMRPAEGSRLKSFIVPRDPGIDVAVLRDKLDALAARRLSGPERPRAYDFGLVLPTDPMGKAADWQVADRQIMEEMAP